MSIFRKDNTMRRSQGYNWHNHIKPLSNTVAYTESKNGNVMIIVKHAIHGYYSHWLNNEELMSFDKNKYPKLTWKDVKKMKEVNVNELQKKD